MNDEIISFEVTLVRTWLLLPRRLPTRKLGFILRQALQLLPLRRPAILDLVRSPRGQVLCCSLPFLQLDSLV